MDGEKTKCQAKLKNGKPCRYKARPEYMGYCGIHKQTYSRSNDERDQRLALLVAVGTQLIVLMEKAVEYLPNLIEVLAAANHVQFLDDSRPITESGDTPLEDQFAAWGIENQNMVSFKYSPKQLPNTMVRYVQEEEWQLLANMLNYSFDVKLNSGDIPGELHSKIFQKKRKLEQLLAHFGYTPNVESSSRPVYLRTLDD